MERPPAVQHLDSWRSLRSAISEDELVIRYAILERSFREETDMLRKKLAGKLGRQAETADDMVFAARFVGQEVRVFETDLHKQDDPWTGCIEEMIEQ